MGFLDYFKVVSTTQVIHGERIINIFEDRLKEGIGPSKVYNELREMGIGYRKTDMLNDYRRYGAMMRIKKRTPEKIKKVFDYYEQVYEPFRKANKLSTKEAWAHIHEWENKEVLTVEEARKHKEEAIKYGFGTSP